VLVTEFEVSVVKRQRESVDVSSLWQNAAMGTRTRGPFPHAVTSTAVSLSGPWHSVSTATSNWLQRIVLLNPVIATVVTMESTNDFTRLVNCCARTTNLISFCSRFCEWQLAVLHAVSQDPLRRGHDCALNETSQMLRSTAQTDLKCYCFSGQGSYVRPLSLSLSLSLLSELSDWLIDWLTGWLTDWLTDYFHSAESVLRRH
jgi:hypothetical protein